jgi:hypothetical protein
VVSDWVLVAIMGVLALASVAILAAAAAYRRSVIRGGGTASPIKPSFSDVATSLGLSLHGDRRS